MARGRNANTPMELPARGWKDILLRVKHEVAADRIGLIAAGVAFYGFLAVFPTIAAVMALSGLIFSPTEVIAQIESFGTFLPDDIIEIISQQASAVTKSGTGRLGLTAVFSILIALYSASKGMSSLIEGLNIAYDEKERRGFIRLKLETFALTLFLIVGLILSVGVTLVLPVAMAFMNLGSTLEPLVLGASFILIALLAVTGLSVLYRYGPSRDGPEWAWASVGATAGCLLWIIGSVGFAYYVKTFGSYNESFGTLAGVVIMLTWLWLSSFVILLGAELNAEMEAQTRKDTTQGPDEPMGQRNAEKADHLGKSSN